VTDKQNSLSFSSEMAVAAKNVDVVVSYPTDDKILRDQRRP
jgi:hypothetical protein